MASPFAKTGVRSDPYKCGDCGHSRDIHKEGGCKVVKLDSGQACDCKGFVRRTSQEKSA